MSQRIFAPAAVFPRGVAAQVLMRDDLEALVFVRIPQLPSSRAFGSYPVSSIDEYMKRLPADKSKWKIVPVGPRPLPAELIEPDTLAMAQPQMPPWAPAAGGFALLGGLLSIGAVRTARKRRARVRL